MNEGLIDCLELNKNLLLSEWRERFGAQRDSCPDVERGGVGSVSVSLSAEPRSHPMSHIVGGIYEDLLSLLRNESLRTSGSQEAGIQKSRPSGDHLSPVEMVDIISAGEEVMAYHLLLNRYENEERVLSFNESEKDFEEVDRAFHCLMLRCVAACCEQCRKLVSDASSGCLGEPLTLPKLKPITPTRMIPRAKKTSERRDLIKLIIFDSICRLSYRLKLKSKNCKAVT